MEELSNSNKSLLAKWYVVQTKPRQEFRAKEHLENQGYFVILPTCIVQTVRHSKISEKIQVLFSRYLFIRLDDVSSNWAPIRSTRGVHQLLRFGKESLPIAVPDQLIEQLQQAPIVFKKALFQKEERILVNEGPFKGFEGIFQQLVHTDSGEVRAMILLKFLGKNQRVNLSLDVVRPAH